MPIFHDLKNTLGRIHKLSKEELRAKLEELPTDGTRDELRVRLIEYARSTAEHIVTQPEESNRGSTASVQIFLPRFPTTRGMEERCCPKKETRRCTTLRHSSTQSENGEYNLTAKMASLSLRDSRISARVMESLPNSFADAYRYSSKTRLSSGTAITAADGSHGKTSRPLSDEISHR